MAPRHRFALKTSPEAITQGVVAVLRGEMSQMEAHRTYGVPRRTLQRYIDRIKADLDRHDHQAVRPVRGTEGRNSGRILAIPDTHDAPHRNKDRFRWFGRLAVDESVDAIEQIGDWASLDSINRHEGNETHRGRGKPSFDMDMASLDASFEAFDEGLGPQGRKIPRTVRLGNHEGRIWTFENLNPELFGMMRDRLTGIIEQWGWGWTPYGEFGQTFGVTFVHAPINAANKPSGGVNVASLAGKAALTDMFFGHTHRKNVRTEPKQGGDLITVIEGGCALPHGQVERYAGHGAHGWSWGVWVLDVIDGRIDDFKWHSMRSLERRYG